MIEIGVNAKPLLTALDRLQVGLSERETVNRQIGAQLFSWVQRNFLSSGGLLATPWAPLSPKRLKWKLAHGWSPLPLLMTGNLRQSFLPFSDNDQAGVGAAASFNVDYAEVHEYGSKSKNIPARPMLPPQEVVNNYGTRAYELFLAQQRQKVGL